MMQELLAGDLKSTAAFFDRSTSALAEADSTFAPNDEMYTVAAHVAHAAQTIEWFIDGAFNPQGFNLDFEQHVRDAKACTSLTEARQRLKKAMEQAMQAVHNHSEQEWRQPLAAGPIMGGLPRFTIIGAIADHTAHHRGALAVYTRLLGKVPPMPYGA